MNRASDVLRPIEDRLVRGIAGVSSTEKRLRRAQRSTFNVQRSTFNRRDERGFWLLEALLAVTIFSLGMLALGQCVNNCLVAERVKQDDVRARLALGNRMAEIEAGAVIPSDSSVEELQGAFEGMMLRQTRVPLKRKNENGLELAGLYTVLLELTWKADGQELSRQLSFYVAPRAR